jgi:hypothetical protein
VIAALDFEQNSMCALVKFMSLGLVDTRKLVNALIEEIQS